MPIYADLYLDRIDLARHAGGETCEVCHVDSWEELVERLRSGRFCSGQCPHWPRARVEAFLVALDAGNVLPRIPALQVPQPAGAGLMDLNRPTGASPVLVTGNSRLTHEVLLAVLSTTTSPMWVLSIDTGGHTVDMSLVYQTLTPQAVCDAVRDGQRRADALLGRIILPGLAERFAAPVTEMLGRRVEVGPVCAAELPLYLGPDWQ
jgi:hypothetical protein